MSRGILLDAPAARMDWLDRPASGSQRVAAVDLLRGLVMVLMALDHVRDFLNDDRFRFDPTDLAKTTPVLFLTRWVTHFCAPVFVFLAGTGAFLAGCHGKTRSQLAWFLLTRGLWLVVLEFTLVQWGWAFVIDYHQMVGQVIWAIGWSMVALAGLVWLPTGLIAALGVALVAGHNLLDPYFPPGPFSSAKPWTLLFQIGAVEPEKGRIFVVAYPVLPWLGIMLAGYGFGSLWLVNWPRRRRLLLGLGTALTLAFFALRASNRYGDPQPWSQQSTDLFTLFSFINCTKYPPSLLYVLMTLGPSILLLALWDRTPGPLGRVLITFGRVPLFYYLLHAPLIHLAAIALALVRYGDAGFLFQNFLFVGPNQVPPGYGYGLPVVYAVWLAVVVLLYPLCYWFAGVKRRHRSAWLSYL
jgi:uncharacterized membrane protein